MFFSPFQTIFTSGDGEVWQQETHSKDEIDYRGEMVEMDPFAYLDFLEKKVGQEEKLDPW